MQGAVNRLLHEGMAAAERGNLVQAETNFRAAILQNPRNVDALFELAGVLYMRRQLREAIDLISMCINIDPQHPHFYSHRGVLRKEMGDLRGAITDFDAELRAHPNDVETVLSRGATFAAAGDVRAALGDYERVMVLAPRDPRPYVNRGLLRADTDPQQAIADFSMAIDRDQRKADAYLGRGFVLRARGQRREALTDFRAYLRLDGPRQFGSGALVEGWIRELERELDDAG